VRPEPQRADALLAEAERALRPLAEAHRVTLEFRAGADASAPWVSVDGARVLQVLSNLVGNAIKFTPEGRAVRVTWEVDDGALSFAVADEGPGIPADQLPHVFGAMWQAREGDRRGVGLGLWIARAIVDAHEGRIWVESREGEGAVFRVELPSAQVAEPGTADDAD
jgi:signal transduction histidine kinase